jgi:ATP-dependent Clp protease ATP-binding subunit ClpA
MGIVALQESGIDQWSFERDTACLLEALNLPDEKELLFDFRAVSAVSTAAIIEAKMLERTYVDSDHILMALLRQEDDTLRTLFIKHGLTYENFKAKSRGILGGADEQKGGQEQKDRHVGLGFFVKCAPSTVRPKDGF